MKDINNQFNQSQMHYQPNVQNQQYNNQPPHPTYPVVPSQTQYHAQLSKENNSKNFRKGCLLYGVGIFIITLLFLSFFVFIAVLLGAANTDKVSSLDHSNGFENIKDNNTEIAEIDKIINENSFNVPTDAQRSEAYVKAYIRSLDDPWAHYFSPNDVSTFTEAMNVDYSGIGVQLNEMEDGTAYVSAMFDGTPASNSKLKVGDIFITINGVEKKNGWYVRDVVSVVRGPEGEAVAVTVYRPSTKEYVSDTITRKKIDVPSVESKMLSNDIGYLRLYDFTQEGVSSDFNAALLSLKSSGAKKLVLDLRNNGGGLVHEYVTMVSHFTEKDIPVFITVSRDGESETLHSLEQRNKWSGEIVVLVNPYTASASEAMAGTLKDYKLATVIGETTFGKGMMQQGFQLSNGGLVMLSTHEFFTGGKTKVNGIGISPDVEVKMNMIYISDNPASDKQLQSAVDFLNK